MKINATIEENGLKQAIADMMDRPTGGFRFSATVDAEEVTS